jgi:hypothetical protein
MLQLPNVVGLTLSELVITDANSRNVSLVNTFSRLRCSVFPSPPQRFVVSTVLTDGLGDATMVMVVSRMDTLEELVDRHWRMRFIDPLRVVRLILRFSELSFPVGRALPVQFVSEWRMASANDLASDFLRGNRLCPIPKRLLSRRRRGCSSTA